MPGIDDLFTAYYKDVSSYLYGLCRDAHLAEDLTGETFLEAVRSIAGFRGDADLRTWLLSIARHRWYHHLRRTNTRPETVLLQDFLPDPTTTPEDRVYDRLLLERIWELLQGETERTRSIVLLRLQGYSFHEIALKHGITEQSARVIDFRAKAKLRRILQQEGMSV